MVHGMLLQRALFPGAFYTLIEQISHTEADLTLAGHNHLGFPDTEIDGKYFINPGALVRLSNHRQEMKRPVQVVVIDLSGSQPVFEKIRLKSAAPGDDVLDRSRLRCCIPGTEVGRAYGRGEGSGVTSAQMCGFC